jgi:hypothetical protein
MHAGGITESKIRMGVDVRDMKTSHQLASVDRFAPAGEGLVVVLDHPPRQLPIQSALTLKELESLSFAPGAVVVIRKSRTVPGQPVSGRLHEEVEVDVENALHAIDGTTASACRIAVARMQSP